MPFLFTYICVYKYICLSLGMYPIPRSTRLCGINFHGKRTYYEHFLMGSPRIELSAPLSSHNLVRVFDIIFDFYPHPWAALCTPPELPYQAYLYLHIYIHMHVLCIIIIIIIILAFGIATALIVDFF